MLSKHPTRHVPSHVPIEVLRSCRIALTTTLVNDVWVTGGTVYGEPESGAYPHQRRNNEQLLHFAARHVCHLSRGPRFLAGDWNVECGSLPVFAVLEQAGFVDLQDIALARWGYEVKPTCKHTTRKDFCYISRELQAILLSVHVESDIFPDHAVLFGKFHSLACVPERQLWSCPADFPWPKYWNALGSVWDDTVGSCDWRYLKVWQHLEDTTSSALPYPVPARTKGRAATSAVKAVREGQVSPPKKARPGEVQPHFVCASFRHAQWLRQTRRLQSYVRFVQNNGQEHRHACRVWGSILRATGFSPSFAGWWKSCQFKTHGAPVSIPVVPPALRVAQAVFDSVVLAFRSFEAELHKASRLYAREKRAANPNAIFQDLKTAPSAGVDILMQPIQATITEVRPDEMMVVLDRVAHFDITRPIICHGEPLSVIHAEHDAVWVESVDGLQPGVSVCQTTCKGTQQELFELFLTTWKQMWERHVDVPQSRWQTILDFARQHLPRRTLDWPLLDVEALSACISQKRLTTSGGLDGVSLRDLRALPHAALNNFISMFQHAEQTGLWPTQVVAGKVSCLAKTECPRQALDFRPITVLGLLYRCWGTFHARHAIRALDPVLPVGLFGSRPQCHAGQIWSQLLWTIELAFENQTPLCGIVADIQKAFNCLARPVVFESCALVGMPFHVLTAWAGALSAMPRRFHIHGSLSPPAFSNCGLPEGCAMSCLGMMVVDVLFHLWMTKFFPLCQPMSYVDDWQVLVADPQMMQPVYECLDRFTRAIDLQLDHKKTNLWSVSAAGRGVMRAQGFDTIAGGRNLGAHVQFTRQHTNRSLVDRISSVSPMWTKLRISACCYSKKVRALKCAAWPRALHGIAANTISCSLFGTLRSGAMRGLKADSAGANPFVHLGLIEHVTVDPLCWSIMQTFRLARDCGNACRVERVLSDLVSGCDHIPSNSITSTLLGRIQCLGWHVDSAGMLHDFIGPFSLFEVSVTELLLRVEYHWTYVVAAHVSHRPCFEGMSRVDPDDTRQWLHTLDVADQALVRKTLNGTHFTQNGKAHCQEGASDVCPYCSCSDSRYHRFWECVQFAPLRAHVSPEMLRTIRDLPEALTGTGWSLAPTTRLEWFQYFASLKHLPIPFIALQGDVHLFTDGSCHNQMFPNRRFAGWAVVLASVASVHDCAASTVVDAGVLPGLLQSAIRAEIYAIWRALQIARNHCGLVHLWSDCKAVVNKVRRLLGRQTLKSNSVHADLWCEFQQCLQDRQGPTMITRVAAHQDADAVDHVVSEWCYRHNALADSAAGRANFTRPATFWHLHGRHEQASAAIHELNRTVQYVQLAISQEIVRNENPSLPAESLVTEVPLPAPVWKPLPELAVPQGAVRWYGDSMVRLVLSWFWQTLHGSQAPVVWVSRFQLYADFMSSTGHPGPIHRDKWIDGATEPHLSLQAFAYKQRTR